MALERARTSLELTAAAVVAARAGAEKAKRDVINNLAGHNRTGKMRSSVHYRVRPNARSVTVTLSVDNPAASFLDGGTRTPIRPRSARALAVGKRTGDNITYAPQVRGQPATHFFSKVADELPERIAKEMRL